MLEQTSGQWRRLAPTVLIFPASMLTTDELVEKQRCPRHRNLHMNRQANKSLSRMGSRKKKRPITTLRVLPVQKATKLWAAPTGTPKKKPATMQSGTQRGTRFSWNEPRHESNRLEGMRCDPADAFGDHTC